jgi:hypothetical protein
MIIRKYCFYYCLAVLINIGIVSLHGQTPNAVQYIGNMGVLVSLESSSILIDGLHLYYEADYLNPPERLLWQPLPKPYAVPCGCAASAKCRALWGIDYLQLAKVDGRWKIFYVMWQD